MGGNIFHRIFPLSDHEKYLSEINLNSSDSGSESKIVAISYDVFELSPIFDFENKREKSFISKNM